MDREEREQEVEYLREQLEMSQSHVKVVDEELSVLRDIKDITQQEKDLLEVSGNWGICLMFRLIYINTYINLPCSEERTHILKFVNGYASFLQNTAEI